VTKKQHPSVVLQFLLDSVKSAPRREKLLKIHEICEARFLASEQDFTLPTIGRLCEANGILAARGLLNKQAAPYQELINAWNYFADPLSEEELNSLPPNHPEVVLRKILAKGGRSDKQKNLRALHSICKKRHALGTLDFKFSTIGEICEQEGLLNRNSLKHPEYIDHRNLILAWDAFARPWLEQTSINDGKKRVQKSHDTELTWVASDYPELNAWRILAVEWIKGQVSGLSYRVNALIAFFEIYLMHPDVPTLPNEMLLRGRELPDFRKIACPASKTGISYNNCIHEMIEWVLLKDFSLITDNGERVISPAFRNPVPQIKSETIGAFTPDESVRSPLPYAYISELRKLLASGPHFKNWEFAQRAMGAAIGEIGGPGRDWFDVTEDMVDRNDPDCVLRVRSRVVKNKKVNVLQMWSPVRWVAILVKLILPLRTAQVRFLDSGEFDSKIYSAGQWIDNPRAVPHTRRVERQQGVFRKHVSRFETSATELVLYINTNKTADIVKNGPDKGYVLPWHESNELAENVYYWLEKLRNWQGKYNPVLRLTSWTELDARHVVVKSTQQLASYPDAAFLFRLAELSQEERNLPLADSIVSGAWACLLEEFQDRLGERGDAHSDGSAIKLVHRDEKGRVSTPFPLHSLRVSLVTALALEGEVPFPILQKLVGHSRLLMTLYYTKPGISHVRSVLDDAAERLNSRKEQSISEFLLNSEYSDLVDNAICNSPLTLAAAVPEHPASRNAAGWMLMHHGLCLVGGNISELEDNSKIGGCYNGGPNIGSNYKANYGPTPGGSRNCVRCRWFVTEPHYLPSLAAHFNTIAYHFDEARNKAIEIETELQELKRDKARMEQINDGLAFTRHKNVQQCERMHETSMKRFSDLAEDLVACWRLIERCQIILNSSDSSDGMQILVQGSVSQIEAIFEETESELLQLSGVCENLELYPDLDADKAIVRRSQLLDSALFNEGVSPIFVQLSEREQLLAGNAFMRRLAMKVDANNPKIGQRTIIELMDAGKRINEHLGIELDEALVPALPVAENKTKKAFVGHSLK
jgi:hypothetical protein